METISAQFENTLQETQRASKLMTKNLRIGIYILPWIGAVMLLSGLGMVAAGKAKLTDVTWNLIFGVFAAMFPLYVRWVVARNWRKTPSAGKTVRWMISTEQLEVDCDGAHSTFGWHKIIKAVESKHGLLLFTHPQIANWIPAHAFSSAEDLEKLRALIRGRNIPYRLK